jgi:archaellum biogenesis protein FlaJ (TadC family)
MADRIIRLLYWPTFVIAACIIILTPMQIALGLLSSHALTILAYPLGGLAIFGFIVLLSDRDMRTTLQDYQDFLKSRRTLKPWLSRYWLSHGETLMHTSLVILCFELAFPIFASDGYLAILHISAFALVMFQMFFAIQRDVSWRAPEMRNP